MNGTEFARLNGTYNTAYIGTWQLVGQSTANNNSTIRLRSYFYYGGGTHVTSTGTHTFTLDGRVVNSGNGYDFYPGYHLLGEFDITVTHNPNGSFPGRNVGISASGYTHMNGSTSGNISGVPSIKRYPTITSATDFNDEENPTIKFSSYGTYPLRAKIEAGGNSQLIIRDLDNKSATSYTFELTDKERDTLVSLAGEKDTLKVRFTICAMNGNTELSSSYLDREMTIVPKGRIFINGELKRAITYCGKGNEWKRLKIYIGKNGEWKRGV